jgi:VCBS repeat-containing protein
MTNHKPIFTSSSANGSFSENANTTDSGALHELTGSMNFKDSDHSDTHTTSASLRSVSWTGGSAIPADSLADLTTAMTSTIVSDSNGSGRVRWSFSAADNEFDFLARNERLVLTYDITVSDNHGGTATRTVTVTITGTDDRPVIQFGATAEIMEQEGQTLSLSHDTASIAVNFVDPDLNNTGHTATVIGASASGVTTGLLPGFLGTLELMSFFHVDNVVKPAGSSSGTINTTFSAPDLAFDYLAAGETLEITYTLRLNDNAGGTSTQTVIVTVLGTNDGPVYLGAPDTAHLVEDENLSPEGNLTAQGDFHFGDIDLSDTHTVSTSATATRSSGGTVPLTEAQLLAALTTSLDDSTGHLFGEIDWSFALDNDDVSFLSGGETLTITYMVTIDDGAGGTDTQTVTITILGGNDPVVITSGPQSATLAEFADTTGSAVQNTTTPVPTGSVAFTDADVGDTHTVSVTVASAIWNGGSGGVPTATLDDLPAALLTTLIDSTGTGSGSVDWTFSIADQDLDFLAFGETLTVTYDLAVADGSTSAAQTVTVTIDGANDATVVTSGPGSAAVGEDAADANGSLAFTDVDLSDVHQVTVTVSSVTWSAGGEAPVSLEAALLATLNDSTGFGSGSVDWAFSAPSSILDFLAEGETLTVVYDVTVADGFAGSTQTVTITITGAEDPLVVNPVTTAAFDTAFLDQGQTVAGGNVIADGPSTSPDHTAQPLTVTAVNGSAANVGVLLVITYGSLRVLANGDYQFIANSALDLLQAGDSATESFTFTVTDALGRSDTATLQIDIFGGDDAPTITFADTPGNIAEDLAPSIAVNGGFESGDLTGWVGGPDVAVQFVGLGGEFGDYAAHLRPPGGGPTDTLTQNVATTPGETYTLSFSVSGDSESTANSVTFRWDGVTLGTVTGNFSGGFTTYTFEVVGNAVDSFTALQFEYTTDGTGLFVDQVTVSPASASTTASDTGTIGFTDIDTPDTHTASFAPQGLGYVGTFSLDPVVESGGSGSVAWHFTVANADIQFLAQGETLTQVYSVTIAGDQGGSVQQDIAIAIAGSNDAPTAAVDDSIITDVDAGGVVLVPGWALAWNDLDPDTIDILSVASVDSSTGGSATLSGSVVEFTGDGIDGGSFTYRVTDGIATNTTPATATIVNSAPTGSLVGTTGDDIIIAANNGATIDGGDGNDILFGGTGANSLTGGNGDDVFAFLGPADGMDTLGDFEVDDDLIAVSAFGFGGGLTAGMDVASVYESSGDEFFASSFSRFHLDTTSQILYFSADGTTESAVALLQLQPGVPLNPQALYIVA